jgi:hypothetical protein
MRVETSLESASFGRLAFITSAAASIVSSRTSERDTVAMLPRVVFERVGARETIFEWREFTVKM